jgi:protein TonB
MSVETRKNSEQDLGRLGGCLVEGDAEQRTRERRIRRRALVISIVLQSAVIAALVVFPLFARTDRIVMANTVFIPGPPPRPNTGNHPRPQPPRQPDPFHVCVTCPTAPILQQRPIDDPIPPTMGDPGDPTNPLGNGPVTPGVPGGSTPPQPVRPHEEPPRTTTRIQEPQIDPALLTRRIEPLYPILPRQMGRSGKVELRAVIAVDGTIQSLQIVSGDALFYQSALDAVRQWRYRPTYLNGQPVEVDTFITVVYTLHR